MHFRAQPAVSIRRRQQLPELELLVHHGDTKNVEGSIAGLTEVTHRAGAVQAGKGVNRAHRREIGLVYRLTRDAVLREESSVGVVEGVGHEVGVDRLSQVAAEGRIVRTVQVRLVSEI